MATPITVNVNFIDLTGNTVSGYMQAAIQSPTGVYDLYVAGTGIIVPKISTSGTGTSVSVSIWGNDVVVDSADGAKDTYYIVTLYNTSNIPVWTATYTFTGSGPINLVGYSPLTTVPAPTGSVPTNLLTSNNIFSGTNTFSGTTSFTNTVSSTNTLTATGTLTSTIMIATQVTGDVGNRFRVLANGQLTWDDGTHGNFPVALVPLPGAGTPGGLRNTGYMDFRQTSTQLAWEVNPNNTNTIGALETWTDGTMRWSSGTSVADVRISRSATGILLLDNPATPSAGATLSMTNAPLSSGTAAVLSGTGACASLSNQQGGAWAGSVRCTGTTGASTLVITPGPTAPAGWTCVGSDRSGTILVQTAFNTTTCTLSATVTNNDFLSWAIIAQF